MKLKKFKLKNISIRTIAISVFIISLLITMFVVGYIVFNNWMTEAKQTISVMADDLNKELVKEVERYMYEPKHMNKVNKRLLESGVIDLENADEREKFFVNSMLSHDNNEIYSFSIGIANGDYYGARRTPSNTIQIMRNNKETSGISQYYSVGKDHTAEELEVVAGAFDPRTRTWYKVAASEGTHVFSPIYKHFIMKDLTISAAVPIYDTSNELVGVLGSHTILSHINEYLKELVKEKNGYAIIIEKDSGNLVANSLDIDNYNITGDNNYERVGIMSIENNILKKVYEIYSQGNNNSVHMMNNKKYHSNVTNFKMNGIDWLVISAIPESILLSDIKSGVKTALILSILTILTFSILYLIVTHHLLKPINELLTIQEEFASGDLKVRSNLKGEVREVKKLSDAFNKMAGTVDQLVNNLEIEVEKRTLKISERNREIKRNKDQLQLILDSTVEGICGLNNAGICTFVNKSAVEMLGYDDQDEIIGSNTHETFHHSNNAGELIPKEDCKIMNSLKSGDSIHVDNEVFWKKDWSPLDVQYYTHPQRVDGELMGSVLTFLDFTERKKMEQMVYNEKEQFRTTLLSVGDAVISTDSHGKIQVMNPVAEELTGWKQSEAQGLDIDEVFHIVDEITRDPCENPVRTVLEKGEKIEVRNHAVLIQRGGGEIPIEDSAAPIQDNKGRVTGVVIVFRDFSDKKQRLKEIEYLSFHDHLTGLYNRRYISDAIKRLDTKRNLPFALMSIDVNGLKLTNDAFGHETGDHLLKEVAELLEDVCRDDDIVGRMGGDEFIILLPQTTEEHANHIKERISKVTENKNLGSVILSLAIGYAVKETMDESIDEVLKVADNNMYKDKLKNGKMMKKKTIEMVIENIQEKYEQEEVHTRRVAKFCEKIAKAMSFDENEIEKLRMAGILHDIGKIIVPPELLNKVGMFSKDELEVVRRHPETSYQILKSVDKYSDIAKDVLYHHERMDGKGYPEGLKGEEIPLNARILTVADAYEAMTSNRPYREAMTKEEAIDELRRCSGSQFDEKIVDVFITQILEN